MKKAFSLVWLVVALLLARPALAQTARIAHLSHGGSLATLDAAADNFGVLKPYFISDSIRKVTDTTAVEYGQWKHLRYTDSIRAKEKTRTVKFDRYDQQDYKNRWPEVKMIGFDSIQKAAPVAPQSPDSPTLKKQKVKRKKSAFAPVNPAPPQGPGVVLVVGFVLLLSGTGWLLGKRRPQIA